MGPCVTSRLDIIREAVGTFAVVYLVIRFLFGRLEKFLNKRVGN